jgi:O-antigen ligase
VAGLPEATGPFCPTSGNVGLLHSAAMERAATWTPRANIGSRSTTLAIFVMLLVVGAAGALVIAAGSESSVFAVKATLIIGAVIVAAAMVIHRPVLFPFSAYIVAVPFEMMLRTSSGTATKFLALASVAVWLFVMIDRRRRVGAPIVVVAWAILFLWEIASLMWSPEPQSAAGTWSTIGIFLVFAVAAMLRVRPQEVYFFAAASIAGGVALAGMGIFQYLKGSDMLSKNGDTTAVRLILRGNSAADPGYNLLDPNHFAASLIVPIALAMVLALRPNSLTKWISAVALLVLLGGVYLTAARGTMIAIGFMTLYLLIFFRQRLQLGILVALGLLVSAGMPSVWIRFTDPSQGGASGRTGIWALAWIAFKAHWLVGIGASQFRTAYEEAYLKSWLGADGHRWVEDSHNLIVGTGVEIGIIGLALMLIAWVIQFRTVSLIPRESKLYELRVAVEAATIGIFVVSMSLDLMAFKDVWLGFMMAVFVRNAYIVAAKSGAADQPSPERPGPIPALRTVAYSPAPLLE